LDNQTVWCCFYFLVFFSALLVPRMECSWGTSGKGCSPDLEAAW
jgi:hypothetical protein